jgi:SAM-dependent methyltransferase
MPDALIEFRRLFIFGDLHFFERCADTFYQVNGKRRPWGGNFLDGNKPYVVAAPTSVRMRESAMKHGGIVDHATQVLPDGIKSVLGYRYKTYMYSRYLRRKFGARYVPQGHGPLPPPDLIATEALMHADDLKVRAKPEWYFGSGSREAWTVLTMTEKYGLELLSMRAVLEFGCGSGRVVRHLREIDSLCLAGTDANAEAIDWDRKNLPGINFRANRLEPPLAFQDDAFDLVYALSVFTHIPLQWQGPWLDELSRVLRPGGYLLATVLGDRYLKSQLSDQDRAELGRAGALTLDAKSPRASYSSKVLGSWDVFQTREKVREAFGAAFEILCYTMQEAAAGQATLVLRKAQIG